jgi:hypothetical protein
MAETLGGGKRLGGWKLLATSRFVAGQRIEALAAWNRVSEPRLDLVQVNGFHRTPAPVAHAYLGEEAGGLLTPERLRRVQRRIEALPATQLSRVGYRPQRGGTAPLEVNVVERPALSSLRSLAVQSAMRALSERALGVVAFGLAPSGDSLSISAQWRPHRSQALLTASHFVGLPGIVTADALWDEQSYRRASTSFEGRIRREVRTRGALSLAHWWTADTRIAGGGSARSARPRARAWGRRRGCRQGVRSRDGGHPDRCPRRTAGAADGRGVGAASG